MVTLLRYLQSWLFHSGNVQYLRKVRFSGHDIKDRPLFIAWGKENFGGIIGFLGLQKGDQS